jgi:hypothetical protein
MQNSTSEQDWWFAGGHLFHVSFARIVAGANLNQRALGKIALGRELSPRSTIDTGAFGKSAFIFEGKGSVILSSLPVSEWRDFEAAVSREQNIENTKIGVGAILLSKLFSSELLARKISEVQQNAVDPNIKALAARNAG